MAAHSIAAADSGSRVQHLQEHAGELVSNLSLGRSLIVAFRLAAEKDRYERPEIYWPDLMQALLRLLPEEEDAKNTLDALGQLASGAGPLGARQAASSFQGA